MAIHTDLLTMHPSPPTTTSSSSTSSSLLPNYYQRKRLIQVATNNSATFIQFPKNVRHKFPFIPITTRLPTSHSSTNTLDTQSISSTNVPVPSIDSSIKEYRRSRSQQRNNPILNNPLLNHRKEEIKIPPIKPPRQYPRTTRLCLSSRPFKYILHNSQNSNIRASTAPIFAHQSDTNINIYDRLITSVENKPSQQQENEQQTQYADDNKYDFITRWLNEVRAATCSNESIPTKVKRTKRRLVPS